MRNFVHISNVLEHSNNLKFEIKNIFSNESLTIFDFAKLVSFELKKELGIDIKIITPSFKNDDMDRADLKFKNQSKYEPSGTIKNFVVEFAKLLLNEKR